MEATAAQQEPQQKQTPQSIDKLNGPSSKLDARQESKSEHIEDAKKEQEQEPNEEKPQQPRQQ